MSSGFSENKDLWGLLSLAGSQNLPLVRSILFCICRGEQGHLLSLHVIRVLLMRYRAENLSFQFFYQHYGTTFFSDNYYFCTVHIITEYVITGSSINLSE